jgi:hypothetical protein
LLLGSIQGVGGCGVGVGQSQLLGDGVDIALAGGCGYELTVSEERISLEIFGSLCSLSLGFRIESIKEGGDVGTGFFIFGGFDCCCSSLVGEGPSSSVSREGRDCLLGKIEPTLRVTDVLGAVGDVGIGFDGAGGSIGLESPEDLGAVGLEGVVDVLLGGLSAVLGLGLRGSEHQWDCDVLKHFAR